MYAANDLPGYGFHYRAPPLESELLALLEAAGACPGVRGTLAWRIASLVATERDPSESLLREATEALREALGRGS
jgi:hypothetical protein